MATASPSAVLHDNSRRSFSLQGAQFHIPTGQRTCAQGACTMALLRRETPDFISPDQWPPNSPDMNPVDYKVWVYEKHVNDFDQLCQRLLSVWHSIGQNVIVEAIDQWRA